MKKYLFFTTFALFSFVFSANTQSCHSAKKANTHSTADVTTETEVKAVLVSNTTVHNEKAKFMVYGNDSCKKNIEGALKDVKSVLAANWDIETHEMTVIFNPHKITLNDIKQKIADAGYDSKTHRAKEEVYNSLPSSCQYKRPID